MKLIKDFQLYGLATESFNVVPLDSSCFPIDVISGGDVRSIETPSRPWKKGKLIVDL